MKVVLDERWNGLDRKTIDPSALLLPNGRMCCLGYLAKECGLDDNEIMNELVITGLEDYEDYITGLDKEVSTQDILNILPQDLKRVGEIFSISDHNRLENIITEINDNDVRNISNREKFRTLKHIFKEFLNVDLEIDKELLEFEPALDTTNE